MIRRFGYVPWIFGMVIFAASCAVSRELQSVDPINLNSGMIAGSVTDSVSRQPIVGAELTLLTASGDSVGDQQSRTHTFAPRGEYRFGDVRPGVYQLRVAATGYEAVTRRIGQVTSGDRITVSFTLRRAE